MVTEQTLNDLEADSIHVWCIDLDGPVDDLTDLLSSEERKRADDRNLELDRNRFVCGRGAMRSILGEYLGVPGGELEFVSGERGKPSLHNSDTDIEFNLTHCEGIALLAVAKRIPVGIDLERIRSRSSQLKIAQRMFPESVYKELQQLSSDQLDAAFFQHWTELEARAKCVGDGIFSTDKEQNELTTRHFSPQDGWIACVAAEQIDPSKLELKHFLYKK